MSEIHIGPHTRDENPHGPAETHHTFDREIDLKSIAKWMLGLLAVTVVVQVLMWWLIQGIERFDAKQDPELTPIQEEVRQSEPPEPRLQVGKNFSRSNSTLNEVEAAPGQKLPPGPRSDLEDMQILREQEDEVLNSPSWIDQGQGRVRVPIDVAMQVIASRGAADTVTPEQAPAPPDGPPAGTTTPQPSAPQPPASQEQ